MTDQEASEIEVLLKSWNKSCNLNNLNKETPPSTSIDCGVVNIVFSSSELVFLFHSFACYGHGGHVFFYFVGFNGCLLAFLFIFIKIY